MFEHLGPPPEVSIRKRVTSFKMYLTFLLGAVLVFVFTLGINQGPKTGAYGSDLAKLNAKISADTSNKKLAYQTNNFSIFDFVIDVEKDNTALCKLEVLVDGIYDLALIDDLKIFHEGTQLGTVKEVDGQGRIYFDLEDYFLDKGQNLFRFILPNRDIVEPGDAIQLSIEDSWDVFLDYEDHLFTPQGDFPISSGLISFVESGVVMASNNYPGDTFLINSNIPQQLATFSLTTNSETIDLYGLTLSYQELDDTEELASGTFALIKDLLPLAQADLDSDAKEIVFNFHKSIALKNNQLSNIDFHAFSLPEGYYSFALKDIRAFGAVSGQVVALEKALNLSTVNVKPHFLELRPGQLDQRLSSGWNKLYSLNLKAKGTEVVNLHKLGWSIDTSGLEITEAEFLIDNKTYIADVIIDQNVIIVKANGEQPIEISDKGVNFSLLVKVEDLSSKAKLGAKLLTDDNLESENFIWSVDDEFYNGYQLPYLPLSPAILSN